MIRFDRQVNSHAFQFRLGYLSVDRCLAKAADSGAKQKDSCYYVISGYQLSSPLGRKSGYESVEYLEGVSFFAAGSRHGKMNSIHSVYQI